MTTITTAQRQIIVRGTFDWFNSNATLDRILLQSAIAAVHAAAQDGFDRTLSVGITVGDLATRADYRQVLPWSRRSREVERMIRDELKFTGGLEIFPLETMHDDEKSTTKPILSKL